MSSAALFVLAAGATASTRDGLRGYTGGNMNGKYQVWSGQSNAPWNDDYASKGSEYFDVWSPEIATHYGQVFWTGQGTLPIPPAIVERFKGKTMAITGYEQDQVLVTPTGSPGVNPTLDVSVPINWAYNHHYMIWMNGADSELVEVKAEFGDPIAHGAATKLIAVEKPSAALRQDTSIPTSQMFSEGNGGESRKSFHGYPSGYAQLIDSPSTWTITPMQIDTRNRECGVTVASIHNCTQFTPWKEPRQARYGRGIPAEGTNYSGILECPCTDSYGGDPLIYPDAGTKDVAHHFKLLNSGTCSSSAGIADAATCFTSVYALGINATSLVNKSVSDPTLPAGCTITTSDSGVATVTFNSGSNGVPCSQQSTKVGQVSLVTGVTVAIEVSLDGPSFMVESQKGVWCNNNHVDVIKEFVAKSPSVADSFAALKACEAFCVTSNACKACSVDHLPSGNNQWAAIPDCGNIKTWNGSIPGDISTKTSNGTATITLTGPSAAWFGVGFNAQIMSDAPWTLIVNSTAVMEQHIGTCGSEAEHCPGNTLATSIKVVSSTESMGMRTVVVTRSLTGLTKEYYTFDLVGQDTIPIITAIGSSQSFSIHKAHAVGVLSLTNKAGIPTCICDAGSQGSICAPNHTSCDAFVKECAPPPEGSLLAQRNPTCNSRQYGGGLKCCSHGRIMLDLDQEPGQDELLRYHMKLRFWFQEYVPAETNGKPSHNDLPRIYYQTEANAGEYDIPPAFALPNLPVIGYPELPVNQPTPGTTCTGTCPDGPDCECVHEIRYYWTMSNTRLVYAGGHCHAPACKFIELWAHLNGTDTLLCHQLPWYGSGDTLNDKYDEAGYLALPPCLWGDDEGLVPGVWLPENTPVWSIKQNINTKMGHFGEMASWQMRGVNFP